MEEWERRTGVLFIFPHTRAFQLILTVGRRVVPLQGLRVSIGVMLRLRVPTEIPSGIEGVLSVGPRNRDRVPRVGS